jgi:hypothetical protein
VTSRDTTSRDAANPSARRKAATAFDRSTQQMAAEARRADEQKRADRQLAAKTERLRALRLARDAQLASEAAALEAARPPVRPTTRRKKENPA